MIDARLDIPPTSDNPDLDVMYRYLYRQVEILNIAMDSIQTLERKVTELEKKLNNMEGGV